MGYYPVSDALLMLDRQYECCKTKQLTYQERSEVAPLNSLKLLNSENSLNHFRSTCEN
jgi:hypothetical protein